MSWFAQGRNCKCISNAVSRCRAPVLLARGWLRRSFRGWSVRQTQLRVILSGVERWGGSAGARNAVEGSPISRAALRRRALKLAMYKSAIHEPPIANPGCWCLPSARRRSRRSHPYIGDPSTALRAPADPPQRSTPLRMTRGLVFVYVRRALCCEAFTRSGTPERCNEETHKFIDSIFPGLRLLWRASTQEARASQTSAFRRRTFGTRHIFVTTLSEDDSSSSRVHPSLESYRRLGPSTPAAGT